MSDVRCKEHQNIDGEHSGCVPCLKAEVERLQKHSDLQHEGLGQAIKKIESLTAERDELRGKVEEANEVLALQGGTISKLGIDLAKCREKV
jgi:hypothetical protein